MPSLNLGELAHVDAGKTSLTERLLFHTGVLDAVGSVDAGTTRTDSMELERQRGITIRSAVASFDAGGVAVTLVDTPGHPDFIAEVERALAVLDAAILVVSAVEGVQAQTVALWRALHRLRVPALVFVNKIDRAGAAPGRVAEEIRTRLRTPIAVLTGRPLDALVEGVAEVDEQLLDLWTRGALRPSDVAAALRRAVASHRIVPVLFGSALTGAGVPELLAAMADWLPPARSDPHGAASGVVFKIDRGEAGRQVYVRMRSGTLHRRQRLAIGANPAERVTSIRVSRPGGFVEAEKATAGEIAMLAGLTASRIGETFGGASEGGVYQFPPATLESVVTAVRPEQQGALFAALTELADQDPLIALRVNAEDEIAVSLYGEIQAEVLTALLEDGYGVAAAFQPATVVHAEQVIATGAALERIGIGDNPYLATVGLRVEPAPRGSGLVFGLQAERGSMPPAFFTAIEDGVRTALTQGRFGWRIHDCLVTITDTGYQSRQSHAHQQFNKAFSSVGADFRNLAPLVLFAALQIAGTRVCEPINRVDIEIPTEAVGTVLALLGRCAGLALATTSDGGHTRIAAHLPSRPAARIRHAAAGAHPGSRPGRVRIRTLPSGARPAAAAPTHGARPRRPAGLDPRDASLIRYPLRRRRRRRGGVR
jgi:ribosomal protection tetracycline resistance protein